MSFTYAQAGGSYVEQKYTVRIKRIEKYDW